MPKVVAAREIAIDFSIVWRSCEGISRQNEIPLIGKEKGCFRSVAFSFSLI